MEITIVYLFSRYSPIKFLRIRKKLILFSEQLTKQTIDGKFKHSVEWHYITNKKTTIIELYSRGLVSDKKQLSIQLSEYLNENLLSYREFNNHIQLVFGEFPRRYNAMEILTNDKL
ncbi:hypothetical protein [Streptococcus uberis]|uniref:hypothetical protein n=1 Tax=Streptococcus uberis TaxID=1349 RepID=UPI0012B5BC84|nr:hypothetical protein [Streptococcus uberis]MTB36806.1 hypothetical protein [Streptococcus uberis]MTB57788.1 hypothetical protein [Streptococcus uberis]